MQIEKLMQEADSREKILDAKIEDQGDKLRLGMVSLQSAIGEGTRQWKTSITCSFRSLRSHKNCTCLLLDWALNPCLVKQSTVIEIQANLWMERLMMATLWLWTRLRRFSQRQWTVWGSHLPSSCPLSRLTYRVSTQSSKITQMWETFFCIL